ncbi:UPF0182 family protein [Fimbriimonadia bacterium ATM]|nr:MAG: UPF0182 family protein [Armatimonadota bacterium]MBC6968871.1 UPF0182 family protein [Armatimonadota bacterium]MCE7900000.1 UPF0182 family protein [Armatimonadetes bacterium ATM1]MDL1929152.1 UPF0182 family protein [Fimbriimonadia bacterium ATM]RIJ96837.1 MAG: hypothetical protein DCC45_05590 [Armatimonadota bacterium]
MMERDAEARARRRLLTVGIVIGVLLLLLTFGSALIRLNVDYLWYTLDAKAPIVFFTQLKTRLVLFAIGFVVSALLIWISGRVAVSIADEFPVIVGDSLAAIAQRALPWSARTARRIVAAGAVVVGLGHANAFAQKWDQYLMYSRGGDFGTRDAVFNTDLGFYVFRLPFLSGIVGWMASVWFFCAVAAFGIYLYAAGRSIGPVIAQHLQTRAVVRHGLVLFATLCLLIAWGAWLSRYADLTLQGDRFTGPGYAQLQAMGAEALVAYAWLFTAIVSLLALRGRGSFRLPIGGSVVAVLIYVGGVVIYPAAVESYHVKPNEIRVQTPYVERAITASRWAYGLDKIAVRPFDVKVRPTKEEIEKSASTLENMRLWDPEILKRNVDGLQSLRAYYTFQDIDVDRYVINGRQRLVMVGARDLSVEKLDESRRSWQNVHLQYTHGIGLVAVPVSAVSGSGNPSYLLKDVPPIGAAELSVEEPRIYYSDLRVEDHSRLPVADRAADDRYVIVRTKQPEFDYSVSGEVEHTWKHDGGVPVDSWWKEVVFSYFFSDFDILLSNDITAESRLLWRRNVRVRAQHVLPFLTWDRDPYVAVVNRRLVWILDGYSTTDAIPYSEMSLAGSVQLNYIRNTVKFTVDAYTGEWAAYAMDENEPILAAWMRVYPGLVKKASEAPKDLVRHFRYPEDMFTLQALQLARYHVTKPLTFLREEDAWEVPRHTSEAGIAELLKPYYVQMRLPDEPQDGFLLILPFTPARRANMIGWLAAHCDPGDYGNLVLYQFPRDRNINGPEQQEAKFEQHAPLSERITLLSQTGSRVVPGNLLVVPIGSSVMYLKTLFLESDRQGIGALPELKFVVLAFSDKIVFAETYERALQLLFEDAAPSQPAPDTPKPPPSQGVVVEGNAARQALEIFNQAEAAQRAGDWAKYGELMKRLRDLLEKAAQGGN